MLVHALVPDQQQATPITAIIQAMLVRKTLHLGRAFWSSARHMIRAPERFAPRRGPHRRTLHGGIDGSREAYHPAPPPHPQSSPDAPTRGGAPRPPRPGRAGAR